MEILVIRLFLQRPYKKKSVRKIKPAKLYVLIKAPKFACDIFYKKLKKTKNFKRIKRIKKD